MQLSINPITQYLELVNDMGNPIFVDFNSKELNFKRKNSINKNSLIAKAIGLKNSKKQLYVIDATAGLGKDAFFLACLGCKVLLLENNNVVAQLLQDGLKRAKNNFILQKIIFNMDLVIADARDFLQQCSKDDLPDVIYLDPMFPARTKSALVKKEMQVLQELIGCDDKITELLQVAHKKCKNRVVVKRPKYADPIDYCTQPHLVVSGKSCRYDVYFCGQN